MTPVRLEPAASLSRVKHSTTEPLHSLNACVVLWRPFKINFFKTLFQEHNQSVKWFESRSGPTFGPHLGPNCLQRLSAVVNSKERVKNLFAKYVLF